MRQKKRKTFKLREESGSKYTAITTDIALETIETFAYPNLKIVEQNLKETKLYRSKEIKDIVESLRELPQYKNGSRNKQQG